MNRTILYFSIISFLFFSSCSTKLSNIEDKTPEQIKETYRILKDVAYGPDGDQKMDVYLSDIAKSYGDSNYTIIFLHGGGYYVSDKSEEENYIEPFLKKGLNVINLNYRLKRGVPIATSDLTNALNFLIKHNIVYDMDIENVILTGFSSGANIATNVGLTQNNPEYPHPLNEGMNITGIINFSGPVDGLNLVEKIFTESEIPFLGEIGKALFPGTEGFESKKMTSIYEPITYFDKNDPPIFLWHGGKDFQIPPVTFDKFIPMLDEEKDVIIFSPNGKHAPNKEEMKEAYTQIFTFLDNL
ncbi:alpha/beta hydrolase [Bizionia arctica]|uniref:BD-FAE-like domain-containing protein n=1 Tax=Bizionia arctica TaxID=1495645 RepID=A0A917GHH8_9FLAO|nr:alpha/beta hydrolase [Bizionia arctica]GGG46038.1 hypothetical protein GCM10010976_17020 [Bizionia arctica]